ncbi:hypothetical protein [Flavobacterium sp. F52]|uniref:hypothetical protein n=1 Tax=Flavobacterium sp. F52 TaxID=1202532 RepID=UPI000272FDE6|nr:hypothetical protein [Flavobacterium sp. F52]EJG02534.1 hypothetical protein FF52_04905 [Flavobacterium sp. F52]
MERIKEIAEKYISSLPFIRNFTCTLLKNLNSYKQHGTGVFVKIGDNFFLFSAAHVFDDFEELFIPIEEGKTLIKPGGNIIKNHPKKERKCDELDVAILILDNQSVKDLSKDYSFLESSNLEINHSSIDFMSYIVFGYPSTWSKKLYLQDCFHSIPFIGFTKSVNSNEFKKLNRNDFLNIIVEYDRQNTPNLKSKSICYGPDLFGISGCGLWYIDNFDLTSEPKLVGIMNEWSISNRDRLIATRIDAYTEILRGKGIIDFNETNLFGFK